MIGEGVSTSEVAESVENYLRAIGGATNDELTAALGWTRDQLNRARKYARERGVNIVGAKSGNGENIYRITDEDTDTGDYAERYRKSWATQLRIMLSQMEAQLERSGGRETSFMRALEIVKSAYKILGYAELAEKEKADAAKQHDRDMAKMQRELAKAKREASTVKRQLAKASR